jgi:exodeoxyribonuclease V alpha subunit
LEQGFLTTHRLLSVEAGLAGSVRGLMAQGSFPAGPVPETVFTDPVTLNADQRAAVALALEHPLALITGGPGTGKTSIVAAILRALLHQPHLEPALVALAAPTGKAAQRMGAALRLALGTLRAPGPVETAILEALPEPQTLHRLLSWHPAQERFRHNEANPLVARVVIVDEASMVSQELMDHLFRALAPGARIVLLGDALQLPSVEGGSVFRDLVAAPGAPTQWLTENYRMRQGNSEGRNILAVAQALQAREEDLWEGPEPITVLEGLAQWQGAKVELLEPGEAGPRAFLERWFREVVVGLDAFPVLANRVYSQGPSGWGAGDEPALQALFAHFETFRILCALKEAADLRGVEAVNQLLHGWMFAHTGAGLRRETPFHAGEPVLMTSNDYRRGVFNGDQGLVLKVDFEGELRQAAVFPGPEGFRAFPLEALKIHLDLCYAMTVHKAQGSEYDRLAILLPRTDHPALTRELLYTALTRARKAVTLVGERERVTWAAHNPTLRETGLGERLAATGIVLPGAP